MNNGRIFTSPLCGSEKILSLFTSISKNNIVNYFPIKTDLVVTVVLEVTNKEYKKIGLFLFIMKESVDLYEEAGIENKLMLANLSPAEEATSKDEVKLEKSLQEQKSKNTQCKTKQNGTEYEPGTLSGFQGSFQCYFLVWP